MPRVYSRLTLHVTDVRVQTLDEIDDTDAIAEGIRRGDDDWWGWSECEAENIVASTPTEAYMEFWEEVNGQGSWRGDTWVVALTFTVEHANIDHPQSSNAAAGERE